MAPSPYDFAILGSTPLAGLVAGLLAAEHGKRVCVVGEASSPFRLTRGIDLSVMPVTRPETWALLRQTTPETLKLLRRIGGRGGIRRTSAIFVGETAAGIDALSHLRHIALGFDYAVERLPAASDGSVGFRLRDAALLDRPAVEEALGAWHETIGVDRLLPDIGGVTIHRNGSIRFECTGTAIEAAHAILADDAAIIAYLEAPDRDRTLLVQSATALLTEPTARLAAPLLVYVDRDVTLLRGAGGGVLGLSRGRAEAALGRVGGVLAHKGPLRSAGHRVFHVVTTIDGAPLVGPTRGLKATLFAGLGLAGAFFAPALARLLAGVATPEEAAYFAAREAGRGRARGLVADHAGGFMHEAEA